MVFDIWLIFCKFIEREKRKQIARERCEYIYMCKEIDRDRERERERESERERWIRFLFQDEYIKHS